MKIINVIVTSNDSTNPVISIDSFAVIDEQTSNDVEDEAFEFFVNKCKEINFGEGFEHTEETDDFGDDATEAFETDEYMIIGNATVSYVTSYVENVQI